MPVRLPIATYRVQFNREFRLDDARALLPFLERLGISDLYASPLLEALNGIQIGRASWRERGEITVVAGS